METHSGLSPAMRMGEGRSRQTAGASPRQRPPSDSPPLPPTHPPFGCKLAKLTTALCWSEASITCPSLVESPNPARVGWGFS